MIAAILLLYARSERKQGQVGALYLDFAPAPGDFLLIEFLRNDDRFLYGSAVNIAVYIAHCLILYNSGAFRE